VGTYLTVSDLLPRMDSLSGKGIGGVRDQEAGLTGQLDDQYSIFGFRAWFVPASLVPRSNFSVTTSIDSIDSFP
jgi:hypothetical protein